MKNCCFPRYSCQHLIKSLNKSHLVMHIGPDLKEVDFNQVLDIFKDKNHRIAISGGEIPGRPYPCMKPCSQAIFPHYNSVDLAATPPCPAY